MNWILIPTHMFLWVITNYTKVRFVLILNLENIISHDMSSFFNRFFHFQRFMIMGAPLTLLVQLVLYFPYHLYLSLPSLQVPMPLSRTPIQMLMSPEQVTPLVTSSLGILGMFPFSPPLSTHSTPCESSFNSLPPSLSLNILPTYVPILTSLHSSTNTTIGVVGTSAPSPPKRTHPIVTRAQTRSLKPQIFSTITVLSFVPTCYS